MLSLFIATACQAHNDKILNNNKVILEEVSLNNDNKQPLELEKDCHFQEKIVGDDYFYRAPCGGWWVIYSHHTHKGSIEDPGIMLFYISLAQADNKWHKKPLEVDWLALFSTKQEAEKLICQEITHPSAKVERILISKLELNCVKQ
jgi:hypothetical protein